MKIEGLLLFEHGGDWAYHLYTVVVNYKYLNKTL